MIIRTIIAACFLSLTFSACGPAEKVPPTVGEAKDFAAACDKANEGKRIAVDGYLRLPQEVRNTKIGLVLRLYPSTEYSGQPIGVSANFGNEPNQVVVLPKEYSDKDLKVNTATGPLAYGTNVKVSGEVYYPTVGQDFQCALSNPLIEAAK